MSKAIYWLFSRTLGSVWFGIGMMILTAIYVAVGSGRADVREYFEMDELAFFQAWPLKLIMALLVANLVTVTFTRIPFTAPRYGVWMIHTGIVTLIYGMAYYYAFKVEGMAFVPAGGSANLFYDRWERSLYVKVPGFRYVDEHPLAGLPRFNNYDGRVEPVGRLAKSTLRDIEPVVLMPGSTPPTTRTGAEGGSQAGAPAAGAAAEKYVTAASLLGTNESIRMDVIGYWPYAEIVTSYVQGKDGAKTGGGELMREAGDGGGVTGLRVEAKDMKGASLHKTWVVADDVATGGLETMGDLELEHRTVPSALIGAQVVSAVGRIHSIEFSVPGVAGEKMNVEVGETYKFGGYQIEVEGFDPAFPAMNREVVQLITLMVTPPAGGGEKFRRQVIMGREKVTDWKLGVEGAGPMGQRQSEPLDAKLVTRYAMNDSLGFLPRTGREKRVIITAPERMWIVATSRARAARWEEVKGNQGELGFGQGEERVLVTIERADNLRKVEDVVVTPKEKRNRNAGEDGLFQVLAVRVKVGEVSQTVLVPYQKWAMSAPWRGGVVKIPGTDSVIQLQLGSRSRPIAPDRETGAPTVVTLKKFELVSYAGGSPTAGMQRDFKSRLGVKEGNGRNREGTAQMNSPIYFGPSPVLGLGDTYWTLFQAQWDPQGQRFTVLGVGNRPGVVLMTLGSVLMGIGLMYAFYAKPLIIRRMKENAIKVAQAKGKAVKRPAGAVMMEGVEGRNMV